MARSRPQSPNVLTLMLWVTVAACGAGAPGERWTTAPANAPAAMNRPDARRVVASGDPTLDLAALQDAVDAGGKVVLAGTFDLGSAGQVVLTRDVEISGEGATVKGGRSSFSSPLPATSPVAPGPAISIHHLTFDGAARTPIHLAHARSVEVSHNRIRNVRPLALADPAPVTGRQAGILLGTMDSLPMESFAGALTGTVVVRDNELDMTGDEPTGTLCQGIVMERAWGVTATLSHNAISGCSRNAMEVIENFTDEAGHGSIDIANNRIALPPEGLAWPTAAHPNGIVAGWFNLPANAISQWNVPIRVTGNSIAGGGPLAMGMFGNSQGIDIARNRITVHGATAYGIIVASPGGVLTENVVQGSGRAAFMLRQFFASVRPDGNTLRCDDASAFDAALADLYIQGTGNTVIGGTYDSIVAPGTYTTLPGSCDAEAP